MGLLVVVLALANAIAAQETTRLITIRPAEDTTNSVGRIAGLPVNEVADSEPSDTVQSRLFETSTIILTVFHTVTTTIPRPENVSTTPVSRSTQDNGFEAEASDWWDSMANIASSTTSSTTTPDGRDIASIAQVISTTTVTAETTIFQDVTVTVSALGTAYTGSSAHIRRRDPEGSIGHDAVM